jgi:hypothetical protein
VSDLILSSSSVSTWLDCHLQWYFRYVLQLDGNPSPELKLGIAVHEHVEELLEPGHGGSLSIDPEVTDLVDVWVANVQPELEPTLVEEVYRLDVNGIGYQSILDYADGEIACDLKTTARRPPAGRYRVPMIGHALGYRALTGKKERGRRLDYIVKTKAPYHWPETIEGPATLDDVVEFGGTIEQVANGIAREDYAATGLDSPYACATCPYRDECGPRLRYEEERA